MLKIPILSSAVVMIFLFYGESFATKPCPPAPCFSQDNAFNEEECRDIADWIAIGTISNVRHDPQAYPLNKNFSSFDFEVTQWVKGKIADITSISFKIGWCDNRQELPSNTSGLFRFYGASPSEVSSGRNSARFYHYEKIER